MQRSLISNFVPTAKEVGTLVLKMQGMEIIVDRTWGSKTKARLHGQRARLRDKWVILWAVWLS